MENKYKKWYNNIIKIARNRQPDGYTETHHIIPRSLGGSNKKENLVQLTGREHFICHILLTKFTHGQDKNKMIRAVIMMKAANTEQLRYYNSRLYESARIEFGKNQSIRMSGENNSYYGKTHSPEVRENMSRAKKGKHNNSWNTGLTIETSERLKLVGENISKAKKGVPSKRKGLSGPLASEETKAKMRETRNGTSYWWNNGVKNLRASSSPGPEWKRGRLMSPSLYANFCKKN
jgi:5-methylcytosine-specific restriction endonuclease McrA